MQSNFVGVISDNPNRRGPLPSPFSRLCTCRAEPGWWPVELYQLRPGDRIAFLYGTACHGQFEVVGDPVTSDDGTTTITARPVSLVGPILDFTTLGTRYHKLTNAI